MDVSAFHFRPTSVLGAGGSVATATRRLSSGAASVAPPPLCSSAFAPYPPLGLEGCCFSCVARSGFAAAPTPEESRRKGAAAGACVSTGVARGRSPVSSASARLPPWTGWAARSGCAPASAACGGSVGGRGAIGAGSGGAASLAAPPLGPESLAIFGDCDISSTSSTGAVSVPGWTWGSTEGPLSAVLAGCSTCLREGAASAPFFLSLADASGAFCFPFDCPPPISLAPDRSRQVVDTRR
mmetsp:Transcript_6423/g.17441  ORF Transcript_6423/g.17441 Transcript_6423/m.17441 type:complete len:240 (-) Transcript_6423:43-762(-)